MCYLKRFTAGAFKDNLGTYGTSKCLDFTTLFFISHSQGLIRLYEEFTRVSPPGSGNGKHFCWLGGIHAQLPGGMSSPKAIVYGTALLCQSTSN